MDWNLAWWLSRWYRPSLEPKKFKLWLVASITYYVCQSVFPIYLSHFSSEWTEIWYDEVISNIRHFPLRKISPWEFPPDFTPAASPCVCNARLFNYSFIRSHFAPLPFKSRYLSHFSSEWTEIWHDDSLDGIDRAYSKKIDLSSGH